MADNIELAKRLREIADSLASEADVSRLEKERQEVNLQLQQLKARVEKIPDYSYTVIPNFFLKKTEEFLKEGIKGSSPEVVFAKMVAEAIDQYLKRT